MRLVASYHGVCDDVEMIARGPEISEWYERATLPIEKGGMAIRNMEVVALSAFACSLATSFKHMALIFPEWILSGERGALLQPSGEVSSQISDQIVGFVGEHRRRVPHGVFKESDDFSAIIKAIVDLENGMNADAREAQLQSSSQTQLSLVRRNRCSNVELLKASYMVNTRKRNVSVL